MHVSERIPSEVQARTIKPLYGHDGPDKAYVIDDYPYGRLRTQKRVWLEKKGKKGFRFVGQTQNPKTGRWNKPKASTYSSFAGAMYLDEKNHVHWDGLSEYSSADEVLQFVKDFPKADYSILKIIAKMKVAYLEKMLSGEVVMTLNGKPVKVSESQKKEWATSRDTWKEVAKRI